VRHALRRPLVALFLPALAAAGCSERAPEVARPPHVVLVVIDCLRADHVGAYGYPLPITPHLDRLAAEGVRFDRAYAAATWTKPSMATLFTGLHPREHGLMRIGEPATEEFETDALPDGIPTLAERFRAAGYLTVAIVNQIHLKPEFGFGRGFEIYRWLKNRTGFDLNDDLFEALGAGARGGRPVFAWLHYIDAHWPYKRGRRGAPPELGDARVRPEPPQEQSRAVIDAWVEEHLDERNRRALMARYDREVAFADAALGDLVKRIELAGALDDTLIVVTADHGEGFFEHGELMHGFAPYDEVARVPLVMRPPPRMGVPRGARRTPVAHADLAPTLLDLLGLPPLAGASGESVAEVLRDGRDRERAVLVESELAPAIVDGRHKLIVNADGSVELYDLAADSGERVNLASEGCTGECAELRAALDSRLRALGPALAAGRGTFTKEEAEELRALGYL
jgi:arylsulfatase A-like enzyme